MLLLLHKYLLAFLLESLEDVAHHALNLFLLFLNSQLAHESLNLKLIVRLVFVEVLLVLLFRLRSQRRLCQWHRLTAWILHLPQPIKMRLGARFIGHGLASPSDLKVWKKRLHGLRRKQRQEVSGLGRGGRQQRRILMDALGDESIVENGVDFGVHVHAVDVVRSGRGAGGELGDVLLRWAAHYLHI